MIKKQRGYLALVSAALIVIIGFMGIALTYMIVGSSTSSSYHQLSSQAFYIAEGGLEKTIRYLLTPSLTGSAARIACGSVSGNANLTAYSIGNGTTTVTATGPFYVSSTTTVNGALGASATTVPVASTANYQSSGRIMIDKELMNYTAVNSTNFLGVTRGVDSSTATTHSSGTRVGQYQCNLSASGGVPNLSSPIASRSLQEQVQLQEAWAVGSNSGGNFVIARWNRPTELSWNDASVTSASNNQLNAISMSSYADGWAVGNAAQFLHWDGNSWSVSTQSPNVTYSGVYCNSQNDCHAVGANSAGSATILDWNGASWTRFSTGVPNHTLNSVHCSASNNCMAVGTGIGASSRRFYQYTGSWSIQNVDGIFNSSFPFNSVFCNSATDCWAVGANGTFARWTGSWSAVATGLPSVKYNSIYCNSASDCWAVGDNSGGDLFAHYDGSSWSRFGPYTSIPDVALKSVTCANTNDCWAVGASSSGALMVHWDGSNWDRVTAASLPNVDFFGVAIIGPKSQPQSAWAENFN